MNPVLHIVTGAPGAGKSTTLAAFLHLRTPFVAFDIDWLTVPASNLAGKDIIFEPSTWPTYNAFLPRRACAWRPFPRGVARSWFCAGLMRPNAWPSVATRPTGALEHTPAPCRVHDVGQYGDQPFDAFYRSTFLWVFDNNGWRCAAGHSTETERPKASSGSAKLNTAHLGYPNRREASRTRVRRCLSPSPRALPTPLLCYVRGMLAAQRRSVSRSILITGAGSKETEKNGREHIAKKGKQELVEVSAPSDRWRKLIDTGWARQAVSLKGLYFCIPRNEKLLELWDIVENRQQDIRHCRNIAGAERALNPDERSVDPELLLRARQQGLDIGELLAQSTAPMPHYRFTTMVQRARSVQRREEFGGRRSRRPGKEGRGGVRFRIGKPKTRGCGVEALSPFVFIG